jgi:hypothetical protein
MSERILRVQPAEHTDQITADGRELTKQPYPLFVSRDGSVGRQDFWQGKPLCLIGFAADSAKREMTLWWPQVWDDPQQAVGMYPVVEHTGGTWFTWDSAVESITEEDPARVGRPSDDGDSTGGGPQTNPENAAECGEED